MEYIKEKGGLDYFSEKTHAQSKKLWDFVDSSQGYYITDVEPKFRSKVNVPFNIKNDPDLEKKFYEKAEKEGMYDLKGHRHKGGIRATFYNSIPDDAADKLIEFMKKFRDENP